MKIVKAVNAGTACPTQWDCIAENGDVLYVKYRWGRLRIFKAFSFRQIFEKVFLERAGDGYLSYRELKEMTAGKFEWPEEEENA